LQQGAKVDRPLSDDQTLLTKAADTGCEAVMEKLLAASLETNFADKNSSVFKIAEKYQKHGITGIKFLLFCVLRLGQ
jgi:hypothetical protein